MSQASKSILKTIGGIVAAATLATSLYYANKHDIYAEQHKHDPINTKQIKDYKYRITDLRAYDKTNPIDWLFSGPDVYEATQPTSSAEEMDLYKKNESIIDFNLDGTAILTKQGRYMMKDAETVKVTFEQ
jgi:hypothetical protein